LEVKISGVGCRPLVVYTDERGWLAEIFRHDETAPEHIPVMAYVSVTKPGVVRGPHAHREQTDLFCFAGPGDFRVALWDNRADSPTFGVRQDFHLGTSCPAVLIVPPGVVHAYKNVGEIPGYVLNFANRLYRGPGRRDAVDEIRFEDDPDSPFRVD
jgi:dTDP-4-dehydrorhamnose 3,5-epimerase